MQIDKFNNCKKHLSCNLSQLKSIYLNLYGFMQK